MNPQNIFWEFLGLVQHTQSGSNWVIAIRGCTAGDCLIIASSGGEARHVLLWVLGLWDWSDQEDGWRRKKRVEQFVTVLSVNSVINVRFVELIGLNAAGYGWRESLGLTGVRRKHQSLKTRHPSITAPYDWKCCSLAWKLVRIEWKSFSEKCPPRWQDTNSRAAVNECRT